MTLVVDASVVVAALIDDGATGRWAEELLIGRSLVAPRLVVFEVANILRRAAQRGLVTDRDVTAAHRDLLDLSIVFFEYELLSGRVWELRHNVTVYDAAYVALAELVDAPLATLDQRLANASGPACRFELPT